MLSSRFFSRVLRVCAALLLTVIAGCGGGGGGNNAASSVANLPPSAALLTDPNVALINVEAGPRSNVNMPYVTVTVCVPGTSNCKSIDHVLLDTGSTGLRIFSSMLGTLTLPSHTIGASAAISECASFLNSRAWGSIKVADVGIGNKLASSVPLQVMDTNPPSNLCPGLLMAPPNDNTTGRSPLSANGILGVGLFAYDQQNYFDCANLTPPTCRPIYPQPNQQVQNPVTLFSSDNNGVVVQLPALAATGNIAAQGFLIFGIGTRTNNSLGSANVVETNTAGRFSTIYKGNTLTESFIDSGSNGLYFNDTAIAACTSPTDPGFYCPPAGSPLSLTATIGSVNVGFSIDNATTLFSKANYAFNNLGGALDNTSFDWGLPFFFGRSVYTVVEGKVVGSHTGPFYAFTN